jgi:hypothetical protein
MYRRNRFCCHIRESGYPEVFGFKEYWIPDKGPVMTMNWQD